jgi:hypothetical protein
MAPYSLARLQSEARARTPHWQMNIEQKAGTISPRKKNETANRQMGDAAK